MPLFALIVSVSLVGPRWHKKTVPAQSKNDSQTLNQVTQAYQDQVAKAPTSGALTYSMTKLPDRTKPLPARIAVITPEKTAERVTKVNDEVLNSLYRDYPNAKSANFYIDYFDDQKTADSYFATQADSRLSTEEKRKSQLHYTAVLIHMPAQKNTQLFYLPQGTAIKKY